MLKQSNAYGYAVHGQYIGALWLWALGGWHTIIIPSKVCGLRLWSAGDHCGSNLLGRVGRLVGG